MIKNFKQFNEVNESWKTFIAGCLLLFSSCDGIKIHDKSGNELPVKYDNNQQYVNTGVVREITRIPMDNATQYSFVVEADNGNILNIDKYAMNPFADDETSSMWWVSNLKEGSRVKIVCGSDCKLYLCE